MAVVCMYADNIANRASRNDLGGGGVVSLRAAYFILSGGTLPSRTLARFLRVEIRSAVRGRSGGLLLSFALALGRKRSTVPKAPSSRRKRGTFGAFIFKAMCNNVPHCKSEVE